MSVMQEFKAVFGKNPSSFYKRFYKGMLILVGMMQGKNTASIKMPIRLQIEITDKCNFDCIMCNRLSRNNVKRKLDSDITLLTFQKIINDINPFYVTLNGLGEPLLNKEIGKIISFCKDKGITTSMPCNLSIAKILNTQIVTCPPDIIQFSIHGASKEVFEAISRKSNYEKCIATLKEFLAIADEKTKQNIRILYALQAKNLFDYNNMYSLLKNIGLLEKFCLAPVYDFNVKNNDEDWRIIPTNAEIQQTIENLDNEMKTCVDFQKNNFLKQWRSAVTQIKNNDGCQKNNKPCLIPWFSTYIAANGNVLPCCYQLDEYYVMGNIFEQSFSDIWNGKEYKKFRKILREDRENVHGCDYCYRDDSLQIKHYGFLFYWTTLWNIK